MRVLMSGASGELGTHLIKHLQNEDHEVVRLVRRPAESPDEISWDPARGELDVAAFEGVDGVVNLSGAPIGDKRWTDARKKLIYDSRIDTTRLLAETMVKSSERPSVFVSQSAIGFYGDRGDEVLAEDAPAGPRDDFSTAVVIDWEATAEPAREADVRVVHPRTGLVMIAGTQLLGRLVPIFKLGAGGPIGDGRQWWSWISLDDEIRALTHLLTSDLEGPVNLVAPNPVRHGDFVKVLAKVLRRPAFLRVPKFGLQLVMGTEQAESLGYSSTRVVPEKLIADGFVFNDPDLEPALRAIL